MFLNKYIFHCEYLTLQIFLLLYFHSFLFLFHLFFIQIKGKNKENRKKRGKYEKREIEEEEYEGMKKITEKKTIVKYTLIN